MVGTDFFTVEVLTLKGLKTFYVFFLPTLGEQANLFGRSNASSRSGMDGADGA
jgi:hypothetical protein